MSENSPNVDSATVEVIRNYLTSTAEEMQRTLIRTAYNTIIYEILDFGISLYDSDLNLIADSPGLSVFLGANDAGLQNGVEYVGVENMNPGDIVLMNYPFWSAAHTLDALLFSPVFLDGQIIGYTACRAHWLDLGAKDRGYVLDSTDVHQEGIIFPGTKIYKEGELDDEILELIRFNSRLPNKVIGDLNAQIAAIRTGEQRLRDLHEKYGTDTFNQSVNKIIEHGKQTAQDAVIELPDGTWTAKEYADGLDEGGDRNKEGIKIEATVSIDGGDFTIDLSGSADQLDTPLNHTGAENFCKLCFKSITTPREDTNEGHYDPLKVVVPEGNVFNATYPAPTFLRYLGILGVDVIYKALSKAIPERIPASSGGDFCSLMLYSPDHDSEGRFVEAFDEGVGWGAKKNRDGQSALMHINGSMVRNVPIEVLEHRVPVRFNKLELRQDSGGAGEYRGGLGICREFEVLDQVGILSINQKTKTENWGIRGGRPGKKNVVVLRPDSSDNWEDRIEILVNNTDLYDEMEGERWAGLFRGIFKEGETISNRSGGGGGYGSPFDRDPEAVRNDVKKGYISRSAAREDYGVAITEELCIDWEKTESLRSRD